MKKSIFLFLVLFSFNASRIDAEKIIVGTKIAEPFSMKTADGEWTGIAFALWKEIAEEMNLDYEIREYDLEGLIEAVSKGEVDVGVSPMTITADREIKLDFTYPYFVTGLGIAVPVKGDKGVFKIIGRFLSSAFLETIILLVGILFSVGLLTWLFERKKNKEQFGEGRTKGIGASFWWAAVTMTTVGYGDKAPVTTGGRIIGLIWMFAGLIIISSITAAITSALTVTQLDSKIHEIKDLASASVGTVESSSSDKFLNDQRVNHILYSTPLDAINALKNGYVDAVVYDIPILKHLISNSHLGGKLHVLPNNLRPQYYGFALPRNSPYREKINRVLLRKTSSLNWDKILFFYLGS